MTLQDLKNDVYFLTGTDSNSYSDSELESNLNRWYSIAVNWIWNSTGTWEYDDSTKGDMPVATTDLSKGKETYKLPTDTQRIIDVEVKYDGEWRDLEEVDKSQMHQAPSEYYDDNGIPMAYDTVSDTIQLHPTPDESVTDGLRIHVSRDVTDLSASDDKPGFNSQFHRILSLGAALDWTIAYGDNQKEVDIRRQLFGDQTVPGLKNELQDFYGSRNRDTKNRINLNRTPFD